MERLNIPTQSGMVLHGARFSDKPSDTVVIAITGVHGNFYSNPFYYHIGETLSRAGVDFIYAQTRNAFGQIEIQNANTGERQLIGSWNENFADAVEDVRAYVDFAAQSGYRRIILAGHSLGANKVIYYLSQTADPRVEKFILLSPANIKHLTSYVSPAERTLVQQWVSDGMGQEVLPFELFGWLPCVADTAHQWLHSPILDNVHVEPDGDFSQIEQIRHTGALLIGTYDRFTYGESADFLHNINNHFPSAVENEVILIEKTGHTYQQKEQELADILRDLVLKWGENKEK